MRWTPFFVAPFLFASALIAQDAENCKDHPLFNRMTDFHISGCTVKDFDGWKFPLGRVWNAEDKGQTVEGKWFEINYVRDEGKSTVSGLQLFRNFENALRNIQATIMAKVIEAGNAGCFICAKVAKPSSEIWVLITGGDDNYALNIVEKQIMEQVIQANDMYAALQKNGYIALDIHFDTNKATIKSDSQAIVDQIIELLKTNQTLKVSIEGHTDNTGTPAGNKKLSQDRANSVMSAVVAKGVPAARMSAVGWGQEKPVADNRTEEGKAKNRRVEIVKK